MDAGNAGIGPNIGLGFGLVARGENFDGRDRVPEGTFSGVVAGAGHGEVGDADIGLRLYPRDHAWDGVTLQGMERSAR